MLRQVFEGKNPGGVSKRFAFISSEQKPYFLVEAQLEGYRLTLKHNVHEHYHIGKDFDLQFLQDKATAVLHFDKNWVEIIAKTDD